MLSFAGYHLPTTVWEDGETLTLRGTRLEDGAAVRVRLQRHPRPDDAQRLAWQADLARLRGARHPGKEVLLGVEPFGSSEALVLEDDGKLLLAGVLGQGALEIGKTLALAYRLVAALNALHSERQVHGSLCAAAVWVDLASDHVVLAGAGADLRYRAPESWESDGRPGDARTDLYAVGILLHQMLTGQPPFVADDPIDLAHAHAARKPADPRTARPETPAAIATVLNRLLAKAPAERYQTAHGLLVDLRALHEAWVAGRPLDAVVLGEADQAAVFNVPSRLYGREHEAQSLIDAFDRCRWGHCDPLLLHGAPGIGKSALAAGLRSEVERENGFFIAGKFEQYKRNMPYSALVQAFSALVHNLAGSGEQVVAHWRAQLDAALGGNARVVIDVIADVELLTGPLQPVAVLGPVESRNRFNTVFRDFVRLFATAAHPLVILLDDLQWADAASLSLLTTLAADSTLHHLLLLGAYRDSEAGSALLLTSALEEMRTAGVQATELAIGPLTLADTTAIVADTLRLPPAQCVSLGAMAFAKTGGNPFFVYQFLRALQDDALLTFDSERCSWHWDLEQIRGRGYSQDVAELVAQRMARLAPDTLAVLRVASCIGAVFAQTIVAAVLGTAPQRVAGALNAAVDNALVETVAPGRYRFVHDRVQQAAYALIDDTERMSLRRTIGQAMRRLFSEAELDESLFEVVTNLMEGLPGITDPAERAEVLQLSLRAGRKARASMAYEDARTVLQAALLAVDGTAAEKAHGFAIRSELFECAYLSSRFSEADRLFDRLVREAPGLLEKAHIYNTKILVDTSQGRSVEAVRLGIAAVRDFGIAMPARPGMASVLLELARVKLALRGRRAEDLLDLPPMTDPVRTAAIGLLLRIGPAAYFNNPEALTLSALKIVRLSLAHGNTTGSSFGYVIYGMVIGAKLGDAAGGHAFGRLAVALSDRLDTPDIRSKVQLIFGGFVNFWTQAVDTTLRIVADGFRVAIEAGDPQYAGYCHNITIFQMLAFGAPLDEVMAVRNDFEVFILQANDAFTVDSQSLMRQRALALRGQTAGGHRLDSPGFDEAAWVERVRAGGNLTTLGYYQASKLQLAVLFGDIATALRVGSEGYQNREALLSQIHSAELHLYFGLALGVARQSAMALTRQHRQALANCRKVLMRHASHAPANFMCWHLLLEAQSGSLAADSSLSAFDKAIESARVANQPNMQALAAELAARSQLLAGRRTVAQSYLRDALSAYGAWQASGKARHLVQEFSALLPEQALAMATPASAPPVLRRTPTAIGLEAALAAAHALADETELDQLLERLLRIAIQGAGAESGQVVLQREDDLFIEATASADQDDVLIAHSPLSDAVAMCVPVVRTVLRRRAPLVIADATSDPQFSKVPDVLLRKPRSIACFPIAVKDRLLGAIYVENNLAPNAFTDERMRLLSLMASEVAVGVERARLRGAARESHDALGAAMRRVELLEKSKAHLGKFVPQSVQRLIDANPDAPALEKREHDVSILFLDIEGYTRLTESLSRERLDWLVRTYFSRFMDIVLAHHGDINETAGDGLMTIFQEDDIAAHAVNAVRAAQEITRATTELHATVAAQFPPIAVNIGINSGLALVGATRLQGVGDARFTFTATGSVTNVAARLGAFATGGSVVLSQATALRLGQAFPLEALGALQLKNVSEPVQAWRLCMDNADARAVPAPGVPPFTQKQEST
jgi:predicted ATPase/class 3 adenylate cyclase